MTKHIRTKIDAVQFRRYKGMDTIPLNLPHATRVGKDGKSRQIGKAPLDKLWVTRKYDSAQVIARCIAEGRNMGQRLHRVDMVIDVDARSGGLASLEKLTEDFPNLDLSQYPRNRTGANGFHIFGKKPADLKINTKLAAYPGLEFKTFGSQVVCGGSVHPQTLKHYQLDDFSLPNDAGLWPDDLLELVTRKRREAGSGEHVLYSPDQLAAMLARIDHSQVASEPDWHRLIASAHYVSDGSEEGLEAFIKWNSTNPDYPDEGDLIREKWDRMSVDKPPEDMAKAGTLHQFLREAGAADAIPHVAAKDDFDEPIDPTWLNDSASKESKSKFKTLIIKDPALIAPREWVYRPIYLRKYVTLTTARGGTGKSSLVMTEAMAMATGKPLLGIEPVRPLVVVYWCGEDPQDEIERRFNAIAKHYEISNDDLGGRVLFRSGRDLPIKIASMKNGAFKISIPMVDALTRELKRVKADVMIVDPFVSSHAVSENDTVAMDAVAKKWGEIADHCDLASGLVHHNRKMMSGPTGAIEDSRGASSLIDAARVRRAVNTMTDSQADAAGIKRSDRHFYISADRSRTNVAPPAAALDWYQLVSVDLANMTIYQDSDVLGVPTVFDYVPLENVATSADEDNAILAALRKRDDWRSNYKANEWIGYEIARVLGVSIDGAEHKKERARIKKIIKGWIEDGTLIGYQKKDKTGVWRDFLKVADSSISHQ